MPERPSLAVGEKVLIHGTDADWELTIENVVPAANPADRDDDSRVKLVGKAKKLRDHTPEGRRKAFARGAGVTELQVKSDG